MTPDDRRAHLARAAELVPDGARRGREYCVALAKITDAWVVELFEAALAAHPTKHRVALLAVGGYGRGELAPHSDLDLLLVHNCKPRKVPAEIEPLASALWYPLWDAGVKLGHAVRRVDEQLDLVDGDLDSATALLTARFLAGDQEIAAEVTERGQRSWESQRTTYLTALRARMMARQSESADVAYRLEPDLKNGHGGLRDVQTVWWAMASGLEVIDQDLVDLDTCYDTLLRARVALHLTTDRAGEVMRLEDQDAIAATGGWSDADGMMADVAVAGRTTAWLCDENWNRAIERDPQADRAIAPGVVLRNGEIELTEGADPRRDPTLALQAAVAAARSDCRIGRATLSRLRDQVEPWPGDWPVGARTELVALLLEGHRAIRVLEALDQRRLDRTLAARVGAGAVQAAAQRLPPVHRRSPPLGGGRQRRRAGSNACRAPTCSSSVHCSTTWARATRAITPRSASSWSARSRRGSATAAATSRRWWRWSSTTCCCPTWRCGAICPTRRRSTSWPGRSVRSSGSNSSTRSPRPTRSRPDRRPGAAGRRSWSTNWRAGRARARWRDVAEATWQLFPDAETLALMAAGDVDVSRDDDLVTVVYPDAARHVRPDRRRVVAARARRVQRSGPLRRAAAWRRRSSASARPSGESTGARSKATCATGSAHELAIEARLVERAKTYRRRGVCRPTHRGRRRSKFTTVRRATPR